MTDPNRWRRRAPSLAAGSNPCRGQMKYREQPRERFLTAAEFRRLGHALDRAESGGAISAHAAAAIRLLMLTGCRKNEILTLRWKDVDPKSMELHLADTKTGARTVPLSPEAVRVLAGLPRAEGNPWVIQGRKKGERLCYIDRQWWLVRERAKFGDVRLHDCRHSFASRALALGESLPAIGKLLGPCPRRDHSALCASGARLHARGGGAGRRQHRGRHTVIPPDGLRSTSLPSAHVRRGERPAACKIPLPQVSGVSWWGQLRAVDELSGIGVVCDAKIRGPTVTLVLPGVYFYSKLR